MTRPTASFVAYDHRIESDIAIIGADRCPATSPRPTDIRIATSAPLTAMIPDGPIYIWDGDALDFLPPGVARYRCRRDSIEVAAAPDVDPDAIGELLIATALPALLWMRGAFVLHAAAVMLPGSDLAILIAGRSGIGKSTIVAQLVDRGARLIADDTVRIAHSETTLSVSGLGAGFFIRDGGSDSRVFREVPTSARCHRAPLGAIFFLSRDPDLDSITPMSGVAAVEGLLANRHRPKVPDMLGLQQKGLQDCAGIAHRIPAYHWQRRENMPILTSAEWDILASPAWRKK